MRKLLSIITFFILIFGCMCLYFSIIYPTTAPLKSIQYFVESLTKPHSNLTKQIIGFLPYWRLDNSQFIRPNELSEINYFSLSVGNNGHLLKIVNGQTDPGWNGWIKQSTKDLLTRAQIMGTSVSVTVAAQDNQLIESILNSNIAQNNLISDIIMQLKQRRFNGINIDFEYTGEPDIIYQQAFTSFSKKLASQLKQQIPDAKLTLSIMPLSARQKGLYELAKLVPIYDHFIGMSYDYYGQNSDIAGPVAPMNGFKQKKYFFDIVTTYEDYKKYIPKNKLMMGIPTYGWEWAVVDGKTITSKTFPAINPNSYAVVISYARARENSALKPNQCHWDTVSEETWCWFRDKQSSIDHQTWIIDNRSLQTRFDYANQQNFGGIALWTLGLDKNYPDIWDRIQSSFVK
ncbi:MAG TPA: glycosyl hydrolase family 18 protein [Candidatus Sulfotelmatobacter sp.]|nr:glycosyl hydrolase family 18 protein [Candidatus Sulfotelmatobacter sp.]